MKLNSQKTIGIIAEKADDSKRSSGDLLIFLILILATIIINMRMIRDGLNGMEDMRWHLTWLQHFFQQFTEGILYPRWLAGTNYGYGSPTFVFYPPLVYYLGSFLKLVIVDTQNTVIILYSLAIFLSGFNCYLFCQNRYGKFPALVGALAYMSAPYLGYNLYWISSPSVAFAIAWIPLGFWLTDMFLTSPRWKIAIALFWTILALTHLPNLLLFGLVWFFYILCLLPSYSSKKILSLIYFSGLGLAIASFFLVPAILEQQYINIASMKGVIGDISNAIFGIGLPLIPQKFDFQVSHILFHQSLVVIVIFLLNLFFLRSQKKVWKASIFWLLFLLVLFLMMSPLSLPIWKASSILQKVQAPWRLFSVFSFAGAVLFANTSLGIARIRTNLKYYLSLVIVALLLFNLSYSYKLSRKFPTFNNPGRADLTHLKAAKIALDDPYSEKLIDVAEYRPVIEPNRPSPPPTPNRPKVSSLEGKANIEVKEWKSDRKNFVVVATENATINIRTYNYPAWHLYVNDRPYDWQTAEDGTILFDLTPGKYNVTLRYQTTFAFMLGTLISILGIICLVITSILF